MTDKAYLLASTLATEAAAILAAVEPVTPTYPVAVALLVTRTPIFSGMGKSGIIAQKAASTFRSLGIPAHYVHPGDASHGDMGALHGDAVLVLLSNSGNTPELSDLILFAGEQRIPIIAITGKATSPLAEASQAALCYGEVSEACPMGLAPTASTAVALALCDALAIDVAQERGVTPETFHQHHPGGKLGARLRTVGAIMKPVAAVEPDADLADVVGALCGVSPGICIVKGPKGCIGAITDGDIRRGSALKFNQRAAEFIMSASPIWVPETMRAQEAAMLMNHRRVTKVLVKDAAGQVTGYVNLHDCQ